MIRRAAMVVAALAGAASADVVTDWNSTYQDITRLIGGAPCPISRSGPMLNLAMYDAVNSIDAVRHPNAHYEPYQQNLPVPAASASREAAAASAAYHVMAALHGSHQPSMDLIQARYQAQIDAIPDSAEKAAGMAHGIAVAQNLLTLRQNDGYDGDPSYTPGGGPGDWRITPDGPNVQPFTPHWGNVTPWGMPSGSMFRPTRLTDYGSMQNLLASDEYAAQINGGPGVVGVKEFGARDSASRTADQTQAAWFWANDRDGTSKPSGQLIEITKRVSADQGLSLSENARLFGLVSLALGDACVAAWDAKYNTPLDLWRPIDAVRETLDDGNAATVADPAWLPLNDFTPPFPAYVSGHATFAGAHAAVMAAFFGTDNITFTIGSDEFAVNPGLGYDANLTRTFTSFSQAAWEDSMSRVWLGVHYYFDAADGNALGYQVGDFAFANFMRPVPAPGALAGLGGLAVIGARRRRA